MVRLGKVYGNRMVDLRPASVKLRARALRMVVELCGQTPNEAAVLLDRASGRVKVAVVMHVRGVSATKARALLTEAGREIDVDACTSDAIALAVRTGAPLYVHEDVINEVARDG